MFSVISLHIDNERIYFKIRADRLFMIPLICQPEIGG
jgi:hypothetical protein